MLIASMEFQFLQLKLPVGLARQSSLRCEMQWLEYCKWGLPSATVTSPGVQTSIRQGTIDDDDDDDDDE